MAEYTPSRLLSVGTTTMCCLIALCSMVARAGTLTLSYDKPSRVIPFVVEGTVRPERAWSGDENIVVGLNVPAGQRFLLSTTDCTYTLSGGVTGDIQFRPIRGDTASSIYLEVGKFFSYDSMPAATVFQYKCVGEVRSVGTGSTARLWLFTSSHTQNNGGNIAEVSVWGSIDGRSIAKTATRAVRVTSAPVSANIARPDEHGTLAFTYPDWIQIKNGAAETLITYSNSTGTPRNANVSITCAGPACARLTYPELNNDGTTAWGVIHPGGKITVCDTTNVKGESHGNITVLVDAK